MWCRKYKDLISSLDIRLKKIVLTEYRGNKSHVNFAKFFILNARMLEYMRLNLYYRDPRSAWIDKQHRLLQIKNKASRDMQLDFASSYQSYISLFAMSKYMICQQPTPFHDKAAIIF
jgi:CDP-glycerol glycerophosphotransferase (TagB/SpsB family)